MWGKFAIMLKATTILNNIRPNSVISDPSISRGSPEFGYFTGATMTQEIWKQIPNKEAYEASNLGNIRKKDSKKLLKLSTNHGGYKVVGIYTEQYRAHRLILNTFVGPCPKGLQCAHLNGIRDDNRVENLKWVTPKENTFHRIAHGTISINVGEENPNSTVPNEDVVGIRWLASKGFNYTEIANLLGANNSTIYKIVKNKRRVKCGEKLEANDE